MVLSSALLLFAGVMLSQMMTGVLGTWCFELVLYRVRLLLVGVLQFWLCFASSCPGCCGECFSLLLVVYIKFATGIRVLGCSHNVRQSGLPCSFSGFGMLTLPLCRMLCGARRRHPETSCRIDVNKHERQPYFICPRISSWRCDGVGVLHADNAQY